jgi:hypothetical protein
MKHLGKAKPRRLTKEGHRILAELDVDAAIVPGRLR